MNFNTTLDDLRCLTEAVRQAGADIAPTYTEYVQLAFAIANDCGEAGRADFLTLCSLSAKYNEQNAQKLFTNALRNKHKSIHLATAFHLAKQRGVTTYPTPHQGPKGQEGQPPFTSHAHARYNKVETDTDGNNTDDDDNNDEPEPAAERTDPYSPLPPFGHGHAWPHLLEQIISYGKTDEQRDVLLLGAFTVLGSSLARVVRCQYSRKWQAPCMQTFVVAPSASGKGALTWVRLLVEPIHDKIRGEVKEAMKAYRREKAEYDSMGRERKNREAPVPPPNRMFLISGNNTGTGILQNIMDNDGTGIICESEADTVSAAIGTEYGHWSDTLRKAFDHDRLSYNRRTDREYREVSRSYLSVLLSGTPAQVKPLIPTAENGLFSRQLFYYMPRITQWADQFDEEETDVDEAFRRMGRQWKTTLEELTLQGVFTLKLTKEQKKRFNRTFSRLFHRSSTVNGDEMSSSVVRLAVNTCRMMSVVALLRSLEDSSLVKPAPDIPSDNLKDHIVQRWYMMITDVDFQAVLDLVEPLYLHATHILSFLTPTTVKSRSTADKDMLFASVGNEFTRQELLEKAQARGIPKGTVLTWIKRLTKQGALRNMDGKGTYRKK